MLKKYNLFQGGEKVAEWSKKDFVEHNIKRNLRGLDRVEVQDGGETLELVFIKRENAGPKNAPCWEYREEKAEYVRGDAFTSHYFLREYI